MADKTVKILGTVFAHPTPANLDWSDALTLLNRLGTVETHHHGKLHVTIGGHTVSFQHTNEKQLDKDQVMHLRSFLQGLNITPDHPQVTSASEGQFDQPGLILVVNHHEAQVWHQGGANASLKKDDGEVVPHDPRHIRHHLTHKNEDRLRGQRAPEDVEFYKTLVKAIEKAPRVIVLGDGTGNSSAMELLKKFIERHHKTLMQRIDAFVEIDLSALTEPKMREVAARYWH